MPHQQSPFDHVVQFYRTDKFLVSAAASFLGAGIRTGSSALVVCTPFHWAAIARSIKRAGLEVRKAEVDGALLWLDAGGLLKELSCPDGFDMETYERQLREVLDRLVLHSNGHPIQIYGEFADLCWSSGRLAVAIEEERLCNRLSQDYQFRLMCSYRISSATDMQILRTVCHEHSHVLSAEEPCGVHSLEGTSADGVRPGEREMVQAQHLRDQRVMDGLREELAHTSFSLLLQAQGLLARLPEDSIRQWGNFINALDRSLHHSLTLAEEIAPMKRQVASLQLGLLSYASIVRQRCGAVCEVDVSSTFAEPNRTERDLLFGILSELMDRVTGRHGARQVSIRVRRSRGRHQLTFSHDGDNFILMGHEDDALRRLIYQATMFDIQTKIHSKGNAPLQMSAHW